MKYSAIFIVLCASLCAQSSPYASLTNAQLKAKANQTVTALTKTIGAARAQHYQAPNDDAQVKIEKAFVVDAGNKALIQQANDIRAEILKRLKRNPPQTQLMDGSWGNANNARAQELTFLAEDLP